MTQEIRESAMVLPDETTFRRDIEAINKFQKIVHQCMIPDLDYGVIPGTGNKPTLLKPGAEKIAKLLGLADEYVILDKQETWTLPGFFRYLIKCRLISVKIGVVVSEGLGECNSMESKYRWRESQRKCPECGKETIIKGKAEYGGGWLCFTKKGGCGAKWSDDTEEAKMIAEQSVGRVENDDIFSQVNTILKMAKKRALVDAALSAGRLSDVFTQDLEDMSGTQPPEIKTDKVDTETARSKTSSTTPGENKPPATPQPAKTGTVDQNPPVDLTTLEFKTPGEFYTACLKHFNIDKTTAQKEIPEYDLTKAHQRKEAWLKIVAVYKKEA